MDMPLVNRRILNSRPAILDALAAVLSEGVLITNTVELKAYECDGLSAYRCPPMAVTLPRTTAEVAAILKV